MQGIIYFDHSLCYNLIELSHDKEKLIKDKNREKEGYFFSFAKPNVILDRIWWLLLKRHTLYKDFCNSLYNTYLLRSPNFMEVIDHKLTKQGDVLHWAFNDTYIQQCSNQQDEKKIDINYHSYEILVTKDILEDTIKSLIQQSICNLVKSSEASKSQITSTEIIKMIETIRDSEERVSIFPSLSENELHEILNEWNNIEWEDPEDEKLMNNLLGWQFSQSLKSTAISLLNIDEIQFTVLAIEYFKLLILLRKESELEVPENWVTQLWQIHLSNEPSYKDLTESIFGSYLKYRGSSISSHQIDIKDSYKNIREIYQKTSGSKLNDSLWCPFEMNEINVIQVNLFNLITWNATLEHDSNNKKLRKSDDPEV